VELQPKSNLVRFSFKMRYNGNHFNYFPENKLNKLPNLLEFKRMLMSCLEDCGGGLAPRNGSANK